MSADSRDWVNQKIASGRYQITAKLGEGGMGFVYRAMDKNIDAEVVIKVPRQKMLKDPEFRERFSREIRSLVKLRHPNIVKISDVGEHEETPFAVMEFLVGGDLESQRVVAPDGGIQPVSPERITGWLPGVASALDFIHTQGFIHRDVKPANILFDSNGNAFLSDFGVAKLVSENTEANAKLTGTGMVLGTVAYMSPELIMDEACDGRVDQYALAVTVYEMLAGRVPFQAANPGAVLVLHTREEPPEITKFCPGLPASINDAVMRGLAKNPDGRYSSCRELSDAVISAIAAEFRTGELIPVQPARDTATAKNFATTAISIVQSFVSGRQNKRTARQKKVATWKNPACYRSMLVAAMSVAGFVVLSFLALSTVIGFDPGVKLISELASVVTISTAAVAAMLCWGFVTRILYKSTHASGQAKRFGILRSKAERIIVNGMLAVAVLIMAVKLYRMSSTFVEEARTAAALSAAEQLEAIPKVTVDPKGAYTNCVGLEMVCLLPGRFRNTDDPPVWKELGLGGHPLWISRSEVTVAQYLEFISQDLSSEVLTKDELTTRDLTAEDFEKFSKELLTTKSLRELPEWFPDNDRVASYPPESMGAHEKDGTPIVGIRKSDAEAFCNWLSKMEGGRFRYRLPTDDEWTCAYRGQSQSLYYWGNDFDQSRCNGGNAALRHPTPRHANAGHPWQLADMAGNVWEFTQESVRGGSFNSGPVECTVHATTDKTVSQELGFRIVAVKVGK